MSPGDPLIHLKVGDGPDMPEPQANTNSRNVSSTHIGASFGNAKSDPVQAANQALTEAAGTAEYPVGIDDHDDDIAVFVRGAHETY